MKIEIDRQALADPSATVTDSGAKLRPSYQFTIERRRVRRQVAHRGDVR
ncbi:hypothetical protein [Jannaschia rubra]|nr:hypothetical protein [Jannaschia rubra]